MIDTAARMRYVYIRTYAGQRPPDEFIARVATIWGGSYFFALVLRAATIRCAAIIRINTVYVIHYKIENNSVYVQSQVLTRHLYLVCVVRHFVT